MTAAQTLKTPSIKAGSSDIWLAVGVLTIVAMLILPLPALLLDIGLTLSITISVLILLTALFIEKPLQLSAFPTILLVATMMRLGLNIASTRLILSHGHEGPDAAGGVIAAFGEFLMGGEAIIGITIFLILIIINFAVITKGAGRIAEVAARFSLDAMPGKQMAIDADLNAGMIDEPTARIRREELEAESGFFGAMDGASKFVKGDAVAGLIITAINIIVGLIIGVGSHGVPFGEAFSSYTTLTVGDGLVSQVPALVTSLAAGLLVSKGGMQGRTGGALTTQLGRFPQAFRMAAALMAGFALLPGLPFIPFALLGLGCWLGGDALAQRAKADAQAQAVAEAPPPLPTEAPITDHLTVDPIRIELGHGLLPLLSDDGQNGRLEEQLKALRRQLAGDYGFVLPQLRITDNLAMSAQDYAIFIRETKLGGGTLQPDRLLAIHPESDSIAIPGIPGREPVFDLPATWITRDMASQAAAQGITAVDAGTVIATHTAELVRGNIAELLRQSDIAELLAPIEKASPKLVADLIPGRLSYGGLQRVLQNLLAEGISIRDLAAIIEALGEIAGPVQNPAILTEHVRSRLARQISAQFAVDGTIPVITLSGSWEAKLAEVTSGEGDGAQMALAPTDLALLVGDLAAAFDAQTRAGEAPVLLVAPQWRQMLRAVAERVRPQTVVLSQNEVHPRFRIRVLGQIGGLGGAQALPEKIAA